MTSRRRFIQGVAAGATGVAVGFPRLTLLAAPPAISEPNSDEDIFAYVLRTKGSFDLKFYKQILGAANEFKEGDEIVGVVAANGASRTHARQLLGMTKVRDIDAHRLIDDQLGMLLSSDIDANIRSAMGDMTLGELKAFLFRESEAKIKAAMPGLSSETIGCVVKLMSNAELASVGAKVFNALPATNIGAKGYLGARVQPNSPTDNVDDIRWQVFNAFSYAVGDVLLGTNPVSSDPDSVYAVELALQEILSVFAIDDVMPHCVLAHIDVQAEVERKYPGSTALWFQSIAGTDAANETFDLSVETMSKYAAMRKGKYGLYFETGQGADFTNGHSHGFDMVLHESRKYGFARALQRQVRDAQGIDRQPWVHINDVAGFIGPEVFRTREQLVRCCLEDIVMGKLHGLCIGLDVCSTLHMDVSLSDLDWCLDQIMPANPAYLMALPTKIDPMLGYLTTGFQDHVRLREKFGYKVNDQMWRFYQQLGVVDEHGTPTEHFGDPTWVYLQYCRRKEDSRSDDEIRAEGQQRISEVRGRGLFIATGHGRRSYDLEPSLANQVQRIYEDGKDSIWAELPDEFVQTIPDALRVATLSKNREDYILHPESGEKISRRSQSELDDLRLLFDGKFNAQIVISDGLNAHSIKDEDQLLPYLKGLRTQLRTSGFFLSPKNIVVSSGRVRAGYRIGETLFPGQSGPCALLHVIGERPGTGHHTFSIYITAPHGSVWGQAGKVDHNITKVVSGVARTALPIRDGVAESIRVLKTLV